MPQITHPRRGGGGRRRRIFEEILGKPFENNRENHPENELRGWRRRLRDVAGRRPKKKTMFQLVYECELPAKAAEPWRIVWTAWGAAVATPPTSAEPAKARENARILLRLNVCPGPLLFVSVRFGPARKVQFTR